MFLLNTVNSTVSEYLCHNFGTILYQHILQYCKNFDATWHPKGNINIRLENLKITVELIIHTN